MPIKRLILLLTVFSMVAPLWSHEKPMIGLGYPTPPPTVDPGPDAATLNVVVRDRDTEEVVSAVVSVNDGAQQPDQDPYRPFSLRESANRHKGPLRFRPLDYYFFTAGAFSIRVPPGRCKIEISKGYEYLPAEQVVHLEKNEQAETVIYIRRWIDMSGQGWYSGDLHLHFDRTEDADDVLFTLTSAKDIKYGFLLSMNTKGYDQGAEFESWRQTKGLGDQSNSSRGPYHLSSGQEYRSQSLGHVSIVLGDGYVPALGRSENVNQAPSLSLIVDQAHQLNGFIGLLHGGYDHKEADRLGLEGKMDFLELFQFGGYRGLGLEGWYDFLNLGYRWPIVGSSDFPYTRELGDCLTYVTAKTAPTPREFVQQVAAGASFVTSGPMLLLEVNGRSPGDFLSFESEPKIEVDVNINVLSPIYPVRYVEIIQNGRVVERKFAPDSRVWWEFSSNVPVLRSGWIAIRAYGDAGTDAHTNPVYLFVDGKRPFDSDACDQILARLSGSARSVPNVAIQRQLEQVANRLREYRDRGDDSGLALPPLPNAVTTE